MRITYGVTEEIYTLGGQSRTSYGIVAYAEGEEDGTATIVASARDLSPVRERLDKLVRTCNRLHLSLIHFGDVIEDFLAD